MKNFTFCLIPMACIAALIVTATGLAQPARAGQAVSLENDVTALSGAWRFEDAKLSERSDGADRDGRPFFATFAKEQADNVQLTAEFELHDDAGEVLLCPAWIDPDNYVAVAWVNRNELRIVHVRNGAETILARTQFDPAYAPSFRVSAAISTTGIRAYIDGRQLLQAGAYFTASDQAAIGGRHRVVTFRSIVVEPTDPWDTDQQSICPIELSQDAGRRAFLRKEDGASVEVTLKNLTDQPLAHVRVTSRVESIASEHEVRDLAAGNSTPIRCLIPADRLRPDSYQLVIRAQVDDRPGAELSIPVHIARRPNPQRMRVFLWDSVPVQGMAKLADMGFNSTFVVNIPYEKLWNNPDLAPDQTEVAATMAQLDEALLLGIDAGISFGPGQYTATHQPELRRVARDGSPQPEILNTCNFLPAAQEYATRSAEHFMKLYGGHPAFKLALLNTEMRDAAEPCFHEEDIAAYRQASGRDIPAEVTSKYGVPYGSLTDFPSDRIVEDDHPLLNYYRWYWTQGDSWVMLNDRIHQTIKSTGANENLLTWFDPALRVAAMYGSGGALDMIGHWTYTYPDPVRIGMNADELLNMARPRDQTVFQMVQAIWYRSETAPKQTSSESPRRNPWDDHDPDADYITPSPAQLTEAVWTAISRPIDMIGYHGVGSLLPGNGSSYKYTHPDAAPALEQIHREVIGPLGPMLNQIDDRPADVAFLQSFTSQVFGGQGTFGWISGDIGTLWMCSQYAGLQSDMIFEETIASRGLDPYKVLILPACEVLPRGVFDAIVQFQKNGGIVIGDELLAPAITPDLRVDRIPSGLSLEEREQGMRHLTMKLRAFLDGRHQAFAISEDPSVVLHVRQRDGVQYVFAINDRKAFGDYVGQHGRVKENGLPVETTISIHRAGAKVIDLLEQAEVPTQAHDGQTRFTARLKPGGGAIYVIADTVPASMKIEAPSGARRGEQVALRVSVLDDAGKPLAAVVPIDVQILDPAFRPAEPSGAHAAVNGMAAVEFELAENERIGTWVVTITERLSGLKQTHYFEVN